MYYPRFTKVIINHFMSQDQSIPRRNKYGVILPDYLTNQAMKESEAYKTYYDLTTRKVALKLKYVRLSTRTKTNQAPQDALGKRLKAIAKVAKSGKKKEPTRGLETLSEITLSEAEQMKIAIERRVPDVPTIGSEDEQISWKSNDEDDDEEVSISKDDDDDAEDQDDDDQEYNGQDDEGQNDVNEQTKLDNDGDDFVHPNDEETQSVNVEGEEMDEEETYKEEEVNELYMDVNVNLEGIYTKMKDAPQTNVQGFISNMINPNPNTGIDSILNLNTKLTTLVDVLVTSNAKMPLSSATTPPPLPIPPINSPINTSSHTNNFSSIPGIVDTYLANKMNEAIKTAVQLLTDRLRDEAQAKNEDFVNKLDDNIKKIIKDQVKAQVKEQVTKILPRIEKTVNEQLEAEVLTRSSSEAKTSYVVAANLSELELKIILNKSIHRFDQQKTLYKALVDAYESDKLILNTYGDTVTIKRRRDDQDEDEEPSGGSNQGSKKRRARKEPKSTSAPKEKTSNLSGKSKEGSKSYNTSTDNNLAKKEDTLDLFNELMDTPLDFSAFVMNRLKVDTLTPELLAGPTFKLMKGSCKSLVELEYFLEEVCKETTNKLDWNNPEGQQYPHDLCKPLPLIPISQDRRVIPFDHFINNNLAYLKVLCRLSTTNMHYGESLTGVESVNNSMDLLSTENLLVMSTPVRRNDDKLYTFTEGDNKRLRLQDIKDMLLLLVQGKLTNLTIEECLALNVSLRTFTRSIVIQRRVEDLQLGVKSYQKKLNLTRPDTYRPDLKSDGTLNDVQTALDDILKRIKMKYLPKTY
ncbi:hypothetical protein Tco_1102548 [Tanacetum coccineum]